MASKSEILFGRAKKVLPGGVNSPVRAFRAVGGCPRFLEKGLGSHVLDTDGLEYIDYVGSWGPMILGHSHPDILNAVAKRMVNGLSFGAPTALEVEMAERMVEIVPHIEMVRMVNSGTEAVMSALRLARGATGRDQIIKFEGCYHGHADAMLVGAGSGALTQGEPDSRGVTKGAAKDTLIAQYNNLESVRRLFEAEGNQIAAVIVEPVAANMGVVPPQKDFLTGLRALCDQYGALLIFDEVITGFRLALGGAQEYFGIRTDLVTFGKIIGGGMPVGAYAGKRELMELVAPCGPVYQAGTLSGNPVAMAAGLAQLQILSDHPECYTVMETSAHYLAEHLRTSAAKHGISIWVNQVGSLLCPYFTDEPVIGFSSAKTSDTGMYAKYFNGMLRRGVYLAPSQFEAMFVSAAHTQNDLAFTAQAAEETFAEISQSV